MLLIPNITEKSEISSIIEFLRAEMIQVGIQEGFTSQKTIVLSQTLDEYILTFQTSD